MVSKFLIYIIYFILIHCPMLSWIYWKALNLLEIPWVFWSHLILKIQNIHIYIYIERERERERERDKHISSYSIYHSIIVRLDLTFCAIRTFGVLLVGFMNIVHVPPNSTKHKFLNKFGSYGTMLGYTCEWSPTLNKDENNEWLI